MSKNIRARINDEQLIDAIDDAAEEHGSMADAIRHAVNETFVDDGDADRDSGEQTVVELLKEREHRKAHRMIWQMATEMDAGRDDMRIIDADAAKAALAQQHGRSKSLIVTTILSRLKGASVIDVMPSMDSTTIHVVDPDAAVADTSDEFNQHSTDSGEVTNAAVATDGGITMDELEAAEVADE